MKLILTIEKLKTKDKKLVSVLSTTLRTDIKTGKQIWDEKLEKNVDELLVLNAMNEIPKGDPLQEFSEGMIVKMLEANKKNNEQATTTSKDTANSKESRRGSKTSK